MAAPLSVQSEPITSSSGSETDTDFILDQRMNEIAGEQLINALRQRAAESLLEEEYRDSSETAIDYDYLGKRNVFEAVKDLYLTINPCSRRIADRLIDLHRDALSEDEHINPDCIPQFAKFFLAHQDFAVPKITLTPDGTLRVRWIHGPDNFIAIEFTGKPLVKVVAEVPRDLETARYFFSESAQNIASVAIAIGASFS